MTAPEARDAVALWIMLAHAHDAAVISPLLAIEALPSRYRRPLTVRMLASSSSEPYD